MGVSWQGIRGPMTLADVVALGTRPDRRVPTDTNVKARQASYFYRKRLLAAQGVCGPTRAFNEQRL